MQIIVALFAGLLFGAGILISGMGNPAKVINFFDVLGTWDPSLGFVMAGALAVTFPGYKLAFRRQTPVSAEKFHVPTSSNIDLPLIAGSALFGIGWSVSGMCPGALLPDVGAGQIDALIFLVALLAGMTGVRLYKNLQPVKLTTKAS